MNEQSGALTAIEKYLALDISPGGELHADLMQRADREAKNQSIPLSVEGDENSPAGNLTPSMSNWLQRRISGLRSQAIQIIEQTAGQVSLGKTLNAKVLEVEEDRLKQERTRRRSELTDSFRTKNSEFLSNYERLANEHEMLYVKNDNRKAKVPHIGLEVLLFFLVLIPESLINYESFLRVPLVQSGAMAAGLTIVVGLFIALASNLIGRMLRQFNYYRRADDPKRNAEFIRNWGLGMLMLNVALAIVGYARFYYVQPLIERAILVGETPPEMLSSIGGLLLGNLGIFLAGVIFTGFLHDPDPEYSDKAKEFRKIEAKKTSLQRSQLDTPLKGVDDRYQEDLENVRMMDRQLQAKPEYSEISGLVSRIKSKDIEVVGLLQDYKEELVDKILQERPRFTFDRGFAAGDTTTDNRKVTPSAFAALPIALLWRHQ